MAWAAWCLVHLVVGAVGAWLARAYARRRALIDLPGERRSHAVPTPRGGGVAIAVALLGATAWLAWIHPAAWPLLAGFGAGLAMVAVVGWVDDHRPLSAALRFLVHVAAAAVLSAGTWAATGDPLATAMAFIAPVVLVNVWNFMDGIDGLAATQAILVVAVPVALGGVPGLALGLAVAAATTGFLPWNFPRARLFLGDVGSGALGFAVGALVATVVATSQARGLLLVLFPLSAFLADAGLTLARRVLRGERWWQPHVTHAFQVLARRRGHVFTTCAYGAWTLAALALAWMLRDMSFTSLIISLLAWYAVGASAWWLLPRRNAPLVENRE